ncbi:MAG TPA: DUF2256 domain-containing protein [Planctomycetaceae bacterium]|nr:DUF2256 domain-containing protein [Planctomycetaceae bacterium]
MARSRRATVRPQKVCESCERPFEWRRKWRACWDDIRFCSARCRRNTRVRKQRVISDESTRQ